MRLVRASLSNPHAVWAAVIALCLLGISVAPRIATDILPDFRTPVVTSFFSYPGLPTQEMEKSVTSRVERALTLAGKIEHQESRTMPGVSVIKIFFQPGADPSSAMNDIVNLEASDMFHLPPGIEWPFTLRSEPGNLPVVLASIAGEGLSETELYKIGYYAVRNKMGGLKGVQIPHPFGGKFRQMMIYVDPGKLRALHLGPADVVDALNRANLVLAGGTMKMGRTEYQVHPINTLPTPEEIDNIPITVRNGKPIFIRDVGYTKDDAALQYNIVRVNGNRSVYCPLLREPGENTIQVVDRIREGLKIEVPKMKERGEVPEAAEVTLVNDQSNYIRNAISNLKVQVGSGGILVVAVIIFFLRSVLPSLAALMVIPLSILIGLLGFYFTGNTINVMTLGGVALAVGNVVNASIVVVENIVRHLALGKPRFDAVRDATEEVAAPILAGTVTTLAVFVPVMFLSGMIRYLFEPLSLAAGITIAASYFLSMTVIPAFCNRVLRTAEKNNPATTDSSNPTGRFAGWLDLALKRRHLLVIGSIVMFILSLGLYPFIGKELFPDVDAGVFELRIKTTPGTRLEETEKLVIQIEEAIQALIPENEIDTIMANIGLPLGKGAGFSTILSPNAGPDTAFLVVTLNQDGRRTSTQTYVTRLRSALAQQFPSEQFFFVTGGIINAALNEGVAAPIDIQVSAGTTAATRAAAEKIVAQVRDIEGAVDVQIAQSLDYPQLDIKVDRTRAALLGLSQKEIAENVVTALSSSVGYAPSIWVDPKTGVDFFIGVQYEDNEVDSLDELRNLPLSIDTDNGAMTVPLSDVAEIRRVNIPGEVAHYNIARVSDVYVNIENRDLASVARDVEQRLAEMSFDQGVSVTLRGPVTKMNENRGTLAWGLLAAAILVYLVMMAQFRSMTDPLVIMIAVPLGLSGVLLTLWMTGTNLNIQSLMGTLMMVGVVVNNAILLVDFANQLRKKGMDPRQAAWIATCIRLRPILMTTLVLVASMLPLSFNLMPGSEAMIPLARALIGGILVSTLLTLFVVPCVYASLGQSTVTRKNQVA